MARTRRVLAILDSRFPSGFHFLGGMQDYCTMDRWELHAEDTSQLQMIPRIQVALKEWRPDGILAMVFSRPVARLVRESRLPVVHMGHQPTDLPTVRLDNVEVGRVVARHFVENGFRKFAYFSRFSKIWAKDRCEGFVGELAKAGFGCTVSTHRHIGLNETNWLQNRQKIDRWLQSLAKPVAIMCVHDTRGAEVAWGCRRLGLSVPDDVAIVGVENQKLICRSCFPHLSSVELGATRVGYEAARLLDRMLRGRKTPKGPISIPPQQVIVRGSSDVVAVGDPYVAQAVKMIRGNPGRVLSVKEIMGEILISRRSLEQRFVRELNRTPWEEIMRVRMKSARNLLEDTDLPIPAVARGAGFGGPEVFAVSFHQQTGMTPTEYRRNKRQMGQGNPR